MKSWKTSLVGIGIAVIGVLQSFRHTSVKEALLDPQVQIAVAGAVLGFLAKDAGVNSRNEFQDQNKTGPVRPAYGSPGLPAPSPSEDSKPSRLP